MPDQSIILITHNAPRSRYVASRLAQDLNLVGIVVEDGSPTIIVPTPIGARKSFQSLVGAAGYRRFVAAYWSLCNVLNRQAGPQRRVARIERKVERNALQWFSVQVGGGTSWPAGVPLLTVSSVNEVRCQELCRALSPSLFVVFEASILRGSTIEIPRLGALNLHPALLPANRGPRPEHWQVLNDELQHYGVTVHFIDAGVDTGDIVAQERGLAVLEPGNPYLMRAANTIIGAELLVRAAQDVLNGAVRLTPQQPHTTPAHRLRDWTFDRRVELLTKMGRLPTESRSR